MASPISIDSRDVLLAIDLQADFMPGGALAVDGGSSRSSIDWRTASSMW
jgi:nicotinamidase-related amidase